MIYDKIAKVSGRSVKRDKWLKAHNHLTKAGGIYEKGKEKAKSSFNSRGKDALIVSGKVSENIKNLFPWNQDRIMITSAITEKYLDK